MEYKFESYLDIGDNVMIKKFNPEITMVEVFYLKFCILQTNNIPFNQIIRYKVKTPDNQEIYYFVSKEDKLNKNIKQFTLNSEYEIGQKVWVLQQDKDDVYVYHIKEAKINHIEWIRDRKEKFQDIRYSAKITEDDYVEYFKGTAFYCSKKPRVLYIYDSYNKALEDQKLYEKIYEEVKSMGGFY